MKDQVIWIVLIIFWVVYGIAITKISLIKNWYEKHPYLEIIQRYSLLILMAVFVYLWFGRTINTFSLMVVLVLMLSELWKTKKRLAKKNV